MAHHLDGPIQPRKTHKRAAPCHPATRPPLISPSTDNQQTI